MKALTFLMVTLEEEMDVLKNSLQASLFNKKARKGKCGYGIDSVNHPNSLEGF